MDGTPQCDNPPIRPPTTDTLHSMKSGRITGHAPKTHYTEAMSSLAMGRGFVGLTRVQFVGLGSLQG